MNLSTIGKFVDCLGIGYGVAVSVFSVITYYCALMALTLFYMVASCQSVLPWSYCWEEWGDECFNSSSIGGQVKNGSRSSADLYFRYINFPLAFYDVIRRFLELYFYLFYFIIAMPFAHVLCRISVINYREPFVTIFCNRMYSCIRGNLLFRDSR